MILKLRQIALIPALVVFALVSMGMQGGCTRGTPVPPAPGTPPAIVVTVPQTALQWTIISNATLSRANLGLFEAVQQLNSTGTLTNAQTRPIMVACDKIKIASESIREITSNGTEASWSADAPKIQAIITQIKSALPAKTTANPTVNVAIDLLSATFTILLSYAK